MSKKEVRVKVVYHDNALAKQQNRVSDGHVMIHLTDGEHVKFTKEEWAKKSYDQGDLYGSAKKEEAVKEEAISLTKTTPEDAVAGDGPVSVTTKEEFYGDEEEVVEEPKKKAPSKKKKKK